MLLFSKQLLLLLLSLCLWEPILPGSELAISKYPGTGFTASPKITTGMTGLINSHKATVPEQSTQTTFLLGAVDSSVYQHKSAQGTLVFRKHFQVAWILSVSIEYLILALLCALLTKRYPAKTISMFKLFLLCLLGTSITIFFVWWVFPLFIHNYLTYLIIAEGFVFIAEGFWYALTLRFSLVTSLLISALCNLASFGLGLLLFSYVI
jgi:hypothetical protein